MDTTDSRNVEAAEPQQSVPEKPTTAAEPKKTRQPSKNVPSGEAAGASRPASQNPAARAKPARPAPAKAARAAKAAAKEAEAAADLLKTRRRFVWTSVVVFLSTWFIAFLRFFFPRTIFEPSTRFRIGYPSDFGFGVDERFKQSHRIWVARQPDKLFVIYAKCTHLGCTPNWIEGENKFKCPCHGSGYDMGGINFEGPAPRPMDRAHVELDAEGQIVVDTSILYQCPPGEECEFDDPDLNSYLVV